METPETKDLPLTWAEIKEFANGLTEDQLKQTATLMDGDVPIDIDTVSEIGEDTWYFTEQDYSTTRADFDPLYFNNSYSTIDEALAAETHTFAPADSIYLYANI